MSNEAKILQITADKCRLRFESFSKMKETTIQQGSLAAVGFEVNRRSEIFLYGVDITLRFQAFYSDAKFKEHLKGTFDDPTAQQVHDFFNELCNLTLGKMKEIFNKNKINVALSLPVSVETSKARILEAPHVLNHFAVWGIKKGNDLLFYAYSSLEIHNEAALKDFKDDAEDGGGDDGEIQFF